MTTLLSVVADSPVTWFFNLDWPDDPLGFFLWLLGFSIIAMILARGMRSVGDSFGGLVWPTMIFLFFAVFAVAYANS